MRIIFILIAFLIPIRGLGQTVNFEDDFTDGDFTSNPAWSGSTDDFTIFNLDDNNVVRLNGPGASTSYLSTPSTNTEGSWEFFIQIDGTAPSGSNKAEVYLMSDIQDLTGAVNGYAVRVGETGDDFFRVVRFDAGSEASTIISDTTLVQSSSSYRVKVTRDNSGNWSIEVGEGYAGILKDSGNTGTDNTYTTTSYFGFKVDYTSSRTDDFYFDFKIDIPPVEVGSLSVISSTEADITFSRNIDFSTVQTSDFTLNPGSQTPSSATQQSSNTVRLDFTSAFQGGENTIAVTGIDDASGETSLADTTLTFFIYDTYQSGDIVINEFMYDPPTGATEYVELRNTSSRYLNLKDWQLGDNGGFNTISNSDLTVLPDSFIVITDDEAALTSYFGSGNYQELGSWRSLNNTGSEQVRILDGNGALIDSLEYTSAWGGDAVSVERRDATVSSTFQENWGDSPATNNGTPGFANEIATDNTPPEISGLTADAPQTILVAFSERIDNGSAENAGNYSLSQNPNSGATTPTIPDITSASQVAADSVELTLDTAISEYDGSWTLTIQDLSDVFSNSTDDSFDFEFSNPFSLSSASSPQNDQVLLIFTEDVDFTSVGTGDFQINGQPIDAGTSISQPASNQVLLGLTSALSSGPVEITINNLNSTNGWTVNDNSTFEYLIFDTITSGDLIINEFMYDPPSGAAEYVEIKNNSSKYLNLKDWQIGDNNSLTTVSSDDLVIYPDSFLVVSSDTLALTNYFGNRYYQQASLPSFNNSGSEQVRLFDQNGSMTDSLEYTSSWGGTEVSLERRDENVSTTFQENWGDSPAAENGTPGLTNEIESDNTAPSIDSFVQVTDDQLLLVFSERIQQSPAENASNFNLTADNASGLPALQSATFTSPDSIVLQYDGSFPSQPEGTNYELTVNNQADIFGNTATSLTENFFVIEYGASDSGDVYITEFMYDPATGLTDFIELYNSTDQAFNLQDWTYNDNSGDRRAISDETLTFFPGDRIILAPDSTILESFPGITLVDMGSGFANLNSTTPDHIVIRNENGTLIDSLTYEQSWGGNEVSLERRSTDFTATHRGNWGDSPSANFATPGAENQVAQDTSPPELSELNRISDQQIQLIFSERIQQASAENTTNFSLSADNVINLPSLTSSTFSAPDTITLQFDAVFPSEPEGTTYELAISGQTDFFGNTAGEITDTFFVIEYGTSDSGDVFITEFMYDPATGLTDFIELYNSTDQAFNLQNWTYNDNSGDRRAISSSELIFEPDSRIVLAPDTTLINSFSGITLVDMGSGFANLNSTTSDDIVIRNNSGLLLDSLTYSQSWGGEEISLERRSLNFPATIAENWGDSPSTDFATPGAANQIQPDNQAPQITNISVQNSQSILVTFSERIMEAQAETAGNYSLSQNPEAGVTPPTIPSISTAVQQTDSTVLLTLNDVLQVYDGEWILESQNITDVFDNSAADEFAFTFSNPFEVVEVSSPASDEILLNFSLDVDGTSLQTNDFILNGSSIDAAVSISQPTTTQVLLSFPSDLNSGPAEISVSGISSTNGWIIPAGNTYSLFIYDAYESGDIIINEFMADPPTGLSDYVEIRNLSSKYLNLKDWQVGDNISLEEISGSNFTILPDSFIVVTADTAALQLVFGVGPYTQISIPNFNSASADHVRLYDANGNTADSLEYTTSWGGTDVALERRSSSVSATFRENWGDSPAENSGTPGFSNQVEADDISPNLTQIFRPASDQVLLIFSERLQQSAAENTFNFSLTADNLSGLPALQSASYSAPDSIILQFDANLLSQPEGTTYQLTVSGQTDIFNNTAADTTTDFFVIDYAIPDSGDIFITEFMYDPADGYSEFIELYNPTANAYNLRNWTYNDNTGNQRSISGVEVTIRPDSRIILAPDNSISELFPDITIIEMGSRFSSLNNTSDAIVIRNQNEQLLDSLSYSSDWGGNEVSLERRSIDYPATFPENWGDSPSQDLATPGSANQIPMDNTPPSLSELERITATSLQLIFSEQLQELPAENTANFILSADNISNLPNLQTATLASPDSIVLKYDGAFPSQPEGSTYELTISNQQDIFNNAAPDLTDSFFVIDYAVADSANVFITEFMYAPATGYTDFIELYNSTNQAFNLQNWTYNDNGRNPRNLTDSEFVFEPGERVVLAPDTNLISLFPGIKLIDMGSRFANLNSTSSDDIVIRNETGVLIDSLTYNPDWGGDGLSLERRSLDVSSVYQENWGDSPAENLATAGALNEIAPDDTAPTIATAEVIGSAGIRVIFSERIQQSPSELLANYSLSAISSDLTLPALQSAEYAAPDTVLLRFESTLPREPKGTDYQLSITNQADIFGNIATELSTNFYLINYAQSDSGEVFITEFLYDPPENYSEFIELFNPTDSAYNIQNWTFNDNSGNRRIISDAEFNLNPDSRIILTPDSTIFRNFANFEFLAIGSRFSSLNNTTDAIVIRNENGTLIDSVSYSSSWGGNEVSLERRSTDLSAIYRENWGDSPSENLATPSKANQIVPDTAPPEISELVVIGNDRLQILFTERVQSEMALNSANYTLTSNSENLNLPVLDSISYLKPDTVQLFFKAEFPNEVDGTNYEIEVSNQTDIFGNTANQLSGTFFVINYAEPDSGDIAINEFLYDPPEGYAEFIELVNTSDSTLNLIDWTYNDNTGNRRVISDYDFPLSPGEYLILTTDSTLYELFPDITFIPMRSRFSSLNNSSDAIVIRDSSGVLIDSLTFSSEWGGDAVSLERRSTAYTSLYKENWGSSPAAEFATPGLPNATAADNTPPEISELSILNDSTLQVIFSERLLQGPATNVSNYSLSVPLNFTESIPELESVEFIAPDTVNLFYPRALPREDDGTYYGLNAENQTDIFGNLATVSSINFFLIDISTAAPGDVVINEFMYDPGENYSEFIEFYNNSDQNFNLKDWTLNDNTGNPRSLTSSAYEFSLGSYVILAPDSTLLELNPQLPVIVMGTGFSSLNNSSDDIVIRNQNGTLIDSLTYFSDWGGDAVSLERKDPNIEAIYAENWGDSPDENFATPGQINAIALDDAPPVLQNAFITAPDTIDFIFNERVIAQSAVDHNNISITPSLTIADVIHESSRITLVLGTQMTDGQSYTFRLLNQEDIFGNIQEQVSKTLNYTELSTADPGDIIVNEILYRRATAESEEFIELFNQTDQNFDLSNWSLSDATSSTSIPEGTQILAGEYVVFTDKQDISELSKSRSIQLKGSNQSAVNADINRVYLPGFPSLNDDEDAVVIKDRNGQIIDSLFYNESWGGNQPGVSLERKDPLSASNDASNWASSTSETGNSLGGVSSVFKPDEVAPEIVFARLQKDGKIFVAFSEFVRFDETNVMVNEEPVAITGYNSNNANRVILGEDAFQSNQALNVTFSQVQDFRGNTASDLSVEVSLPLAKGSVVINEILYDPLANTDDNLPDQTEFIELYNRSEYAISLEGLFIHDEPDENDEIRSIYPVSSQFKWIPPGGYVLFYAEDEAIDFSGSKLANYFEFETVDERFYIRTDRSSLSLASSGDAIYLADSTGAVIDSVFYNESWQNPNLYDTKGVSLERIDPFGPSSDESNWSSSTQVSGATPGDENTIFQLAGAGPENTGISFSPNPFSPDDDGFDDNLFINYKLDEPDYLLRVRIFDRYGRLVRELADGKQAGFEGSLIWDGRMDNRSQNRVGIYIVLFEAYNSANGKNRTFKETVVIARKF